MRLNLLFMSLISLLAVAIAVAVFFSLDMTAASHWIANQQRGLQNQMAGTLRALRSGEAGALIALIGAAGLYGFLHAIGPGHGKYVIGGVGLGSSVSTLRLVMIALASSLAQSLWAIILVYGGFSLVALSAQRMTLLAEDVFAPVSYLAIAAVGAVLLWRGCRRFLSQMPLEAKHVHGSHEEACGCHAHGPSVDQVAGISSVRDGLFIIATIAIRPCTSAIFLLVIAWQMDIRVAGAAAVMVMGLGTALLTTLVAVSSTAARRMTWTGNAQTNVIARALPLLQALVGLAVIWVSLSLLM